MVGYSHMQSDGDGWPVKDDFHEIVLRSSAQCLPMVKFDRELRNYKEGKECIRRLKYSLQQIINRLFNVGLTSSDLRNAPLIGRGTTRIVMPLPLINTQMPPTFQAAMASLQSAMPGFSASTGASRAYPFFASAGLAGFPVSRRAVQANGSLHSTNPFATSLQYTAPRSLATGVSPNALIAPPASCNMNDDCAICQERLKKRGCVALKLCNHVFHSSCIREAFKSKPQCPVCRIPVGAGPQGKSPSGTMTVSSNPIRCSGFQCDTLVISHNIPAAIQLKYHDNPGVIHGSRVAIAYLPNNQEGRDLLKRLKYSFKHGLSFTVGASMTTRLANQCTW